MRTYADWHCDTASLICGYGRHIADNDGHINLKYLENFDSPIQTFAVWLPKEYYPTAFESTKKVISYFKNEIALNSDKIALVKNKRIYLKIKAK